MKRINTRTMSETAVSRAIRSIKTNPMKVGGVLVLAALGSIALAAGLSAVALWALSAMGMSAMVAGILLGINTGIGSMMNTRKSANMLSEMQYKDPIAELILDKRGLHELWSLFVTGLGLVLAGISITNALVGMVIGTALISSYRAYAAK